MIGILTRRGVDFATAEDAVQEALLQAAQTWPEQPPDDPKGWLVTVAWRKFVDAHRSEARVVAGRSGSRSNPRPDRPRPPTTRCGFSSLRPSRR